MSIITFPGAGYVGEGSVIRLERPMASLPRLTEVAIVVAAVHFHRRFEPNAAQHLPSFQWVVEDVEGDFHFVISSNECPEPCICPDEAYRTIREHYKAIAYPPLASASTMA